MNERPSGSEDVHIVEVALNGMLASLDPHSNYMDANAFTVTCRPRPAVPSAASGSK